MRTMEAVDLCKLRFVGEMTLSPDGTRIAFTVVRPDGEANRNRTSVWIVPAEGGAARQLTSDDAISSSPCWSPDGTSLAFTSDREGTAQIYVLDLARGGEAQQMTHDQAQPATSPLWSPRGDTLAFLCRVPSIPAAEHIVTYPDAADRPKVITRASYKREGAGFLDHTRNQLFVLPVGGGTPRQLTTCAMGIGGPTSASERNLGIGSPVWSPDGTKIAFVSYDDEDRDGRCDVYTVALVDGTVTRVTPHDGGYASPTWSPDGSHLAIIGRAYPRMGGANNRLWVVSAAGGALRLVTDFDRNIGAGIMSDTGTGDRSQPAWIGDYLYFLCANQGAAHIWRVPASGGEPEQVTVGQHAIARWDVDHTGRTLVYAASTPTSPGEIYRQRRDAPASQIAKLTEFNQPITQEIHLSEVEEFWLPARDAADEDIQGWIMKPPDFDPATTYPLLLEIHGGPAASYGMSWFHEFQYFAAKGYVIVFVNPRGSQGYGERFSTAIYQGWGPKPLADVLNAVDYVIEQGFVDPHRLYVTGGSYGGYLANWLVTHTGRFRAVATQRCVSDLRSLALAGDCNTIWMTDYYGGMPWEEPAVYAEDSPITHIEHCITPLFIEHEEEDHRCPMDQAEQMYNALKKLGIDTELVRYPHESHGMSRDGTPLHRIDRLRRIGDWFERHN
ncbi:MAG: S9 family peptidase [Chloroflexota bacterium]|nr:S9 family peptidase [Chloroflexota bacterium]